MGKKVVTERMIVAAGAGGTIEIQKNTIITPAARDKARQMKVAFHSALPNTSGAIMTATVPGKPGSERTIAIGADHGGYALKQQLKALLGSLNYQVVDVGTDSAAAVDYPDFAMAVAELVAKGDCARGIMIDGAGIGSCMVANKIPGVRAAMCYDITSTVNSREHNNANVLTLGARLIGDLVAEQIVKVWLNTAFAGGRHQVRVDKITETEKKFLKGS